MNELKRNRNPFYKSFYFWGLLFVFLSLISKDPEGSVPVFMTGLVLCLIGFIRSRRSKRKNAKLPAIVSSPETKAESAPVTENPEEPAALQSDDSAKALFTEYRRMSEERVWEKIEAIPEYDLTLSDMPRSRKSNYVAVAFSNITPKGQYDDIVVVDLETTGLAPYRDRIVEIGAIRYRCEEPVARFQTYINPGRSIPAEAMSRNGITDQMVAFSPTIDRVLPAFEAFVSNSTIVGHNLDFDLRFLYYSGCNIFDTKHRYIDTLAQARRALRKGIDVENHKLDTLCRYYGITVAHRHSALGDAYATGELFFKLVEKKQFEI